VYDGSSERDQYVHERIRKQHSARAEYASPTSRWRSGSKKRKRVTNEHVKAGRRTGGRLIGAWIALVKAATLWIMPSRRRQLPVVVTLPEPGAIHFDDLTCPGVRRLIEPIRLQFDRSVSHRYEQDRAVIPSLPDFPSLRHGSNSPPGVPSRLRTENGELCGICFQIPAALHPGWRSGRESRFRPDRSHP
jgi:hypothetical protein